MIKTIKIEELKDNRLSIKEQDSFKLFQLKESIKKYGQLRPIIVNKEFEIIDGHKIYHCLIELMYNDALIVIINSNESKEQLYCELNYLVFNNHPMKTLNYFSKVNVDNNVLPFTKDQILEYLELLKFDWDNYKKKIKKRSLF